MIEWEYFFDESYFQLWAVRPTDDKDFNSKDLFHVVNKEEAERLCTYLNILEKKYDEAWVGSLNPKDWQGGY